MEMGKNNFSKYTTGILTVSGAAVFIISFAKNDNSKWLMLGTAILLGAIFYFTITHKITVSPAGIIIKDFFKEKEINWPDVSSLHYHTAYHGHGVQLFLTITYGIPAKTAKLSVKQYNKNKMQRLFEILNEQCTGAVKNEHFIKQAKGKMTWKDKLKMY